MFQKLVAIEPVSLVLSAEKALYSFAFEMFQHFAANLCVGIVIEQQFDSVFKIGAFHGG